MRALVECNFACDIFVDLQKTFHNADDNILLKKLDHYGIRGISNKWFESHLTDGKQSAWLMALIHIYQLLLVVSLKGQY